MERRDFIKKMGLLGLGITALSSLPAGCGFIGGSNSHWKNWIWITPEKGLSDDEWKKRFESLKNRGFDAVLVQVYSGYKALFNSSHLPIDEVLLERLIPIGKQTQMEVHAWIWNMPNNNPYHVENNPHWYAVNGKGEPAWSHPAYVGYYKFMCPNQPEVQEYLSRNVRDLATMEQLDGIHLDYIRLPDVIIAEALQPVYNIVQDKEYPEYDYCYCPVCREKFKQETGIDPLKDLSEPSASLEWRNFRYRSVSNLVNNHLVAEAKKTDKFISAAVFPNWESVRQKWSEWNLDAFFPMLYHNFYNAPLDWIGEHIMRQIDDFNSPKPIYVGLFLPNLTPEELIEAINISKQAGAEGISLFSYHQLTDIHTIKQD